MASGDICGTVLSFVFMLVFMAVTVVIAFLPIIVVALMVLGVAYALLKSMRPASGAAGMFFGGARTGLDPVEAGVVLGISPLRILGMIAMSLVRKGYLRTLSAHPLRVAVVPATQHDKTLCASCGGPLAEGATACKYCRVSVAKAEELVYYEQAFLSSAIRANGALDEGGANGVIRMLEAQVESKMAGVSAEATREHYKRMLAGLWKELESTPDDAKAYDFSKNAGWLALDDAFGEKTAPYSSNKRVSRLVGAVKGVEDSGMDGSKLG